MFVHFLTFSVKQHREVTEFKDYGEGIFFPFCAQGERVGVHVIP